MAPAPPGDHRFRNRGRARVRLPGQETSCTADLGLNTQHFYSPKRRARSPCDRHVADGAFAVGGFDTSVGQMGYDVHDCARRKLWDVATRRGISFGMAMK